MYSQLRFEVVLFFFSFFSFDKWSILLIHMANLLTVWNSYDTNTYLVYIVLGIHSVYLVTYCFLTSYLKVTVAKAKLTKGVLTSLR